MRRPRDVRCVSELRKDANTATWPNRVSHSSFHVEHVVANQHGGSDDLDNLCLSCHWCNLSKGPTLSSLVEGKLTRLFNPRTDASSDIGTQLVVLVEQTSGQEGVLKRATSIMVADMRWRPLLSIRWKRSCRRLLIAMASQRKNSIDANRAASPLGFLDADWAASP
jgi:hypothetical protein